MADETQKDIAEKALKLKTENAPEQEHLERQDDHAGDGPIAQRNEHEPVSGAFDAEGQRPALERSRKVR